VLIIKRWQEMEVRNPSDGISWWILRVRFPTRNELPPSPVIRRVFERTTDAGIRLKIRRRRGMKHHAFIGMQTGLSRKDRENFLNALGQWCKRKR
jgi:hypothetical protein